MNQKIDKRPVETNTGDLHEKYEIFTNNQVEIAQSPVEEHIWNAVLTYIQIFEDIFK